jgi:hypothetical protein
MTDKENIKENDEINVYNKSVIYKIVPKDINLDYCYVGSTHRFNSRKATHKSDCYNELSPRYNLEAYQYIRDHGGWYNFVIIVIEEYCCNNKRELEKREQYWKEIYGSNIGKRAYADKKKYYMVNKEELAIKNKQYYLDHKDGILTKLKTDYASDESKRQHKRDYYLKNREHILNQRQLYYNNVVKIK